MRIDKFLKVSRILKRRTVAQEACSAGKVMINGREAKPSHEVKAGDIVEAYLEDDTVKYRKTGEFKVEKNSAADGSNAQNKPEDDKATGSQPSDSEQTNKSSEKSDDKSDDKK